MHQTIIIKPYHNWWQWTSNMMVGAEGIFKDPLGLLQKVPLRLIEAEAKWTTFRRRHFQMHFYKLRCIHFSQNFTEVCPQGSNQQYSIISSDIMAWCRPGDKPLSEQIMVRLLMHICVTWPQWVKISGHWMQHQWCIGCSDLKRMAYIVNPIGATFTKMVQAKLGHE